MAAPTLMTSRSSPRSSGRIVGAVTLLLWRDAKCETAQPERASTSRAHGSVRRHAGARREAPPGWAAATSPDWPESTSSITILASAMSCRRFRGFRSRQRRRSCRIATGVVPGRESRSGESVSTRARISGTVGASKSRFPESISKSTTPNAQTSARLSTAIPLACSGDM